jgi:hypothetical protein
LKAYLKRKNNIFLLQKTIIMAAVAGVTTKKNIKGQITHVTVDVRKHKDLCLYSMIWDLYQKHNFK